MEKVFDINIKDIKIIVHKSDINLDFKCTDRRYAGFIVFTEGKATVKNGSGRIYTAEKGDGIFVSKGENYEILCDGFCSYVTSAFIVESEKNVPFVYHLSDKMLGEVLRICDIWQSRRWDRVVSCRIRIMQMYLEIIKECENKHKYSKDISLALEYIHGNFKRNFSGKEIADYISMSVSGLRAKFTKQTGYTIVGYRNMLRISAACEMLESGQFNITEIAEELGFCDVYHFSKIFKENMGCAPTKYIWK